jgi:hypothetical protein
MFALVSKEFCRMFEFQSWAKLLEDSMNKPCVTPTDGFAFFLPFTTLHNSPRRTKHDFQFPTVNQIEDKDIAV